MTIQELENKLNDLQAKYDQLEYDYLKLREWSDDNDYWLREMIDALTESVNQLMDIVNDEDYESPEYKEYWTTRNRALYDTDAIAWFEEQKRIEKSKSGES